MTQQSQNGLRFYLYAKVGNGEMEEGSAEMIASALGIGGLFASADQQAAAANMLLNGPADATYNTGTGEGNVVRLGRWDELASSDSVIYNGIWGYATGKQKTLLVVQVALPHHLSKFSCFDLTLYACYFLLLVCTGNREYALLCHGVGLNIIDVTDTLPAHFAFS